MAFDWNKPHSCSDCWNVTHPAPKLKKLSKDEQAYYSVNLAASGHDHDSTSKLTRIEGRREHSGTSGLHSECPGHTEWFAFVPNPFYVAPTRAVPPRLRFVVLNRDGFKCRYCGRGTDHVLQVDHVVPVARGGKTHLANLVTACQDCNAGKSATMLLDSTRVYVST